MTIKEAREKYFCLINKAKQRVLEEGAIFEKHHIAPKSLFPELSNNPKNIVNLTCYEHIQAHYYLCYMYPNSKAMLYAFQIMSDTRKIPGNEKETLPLFENYSELREKYIKYRKEDLTGESNPNFGKVAASETRKKQSLAKKGKPKGPMSEKTKEKLRQANLGKIISEKTKEKLRKANLGENNPNFGKPKTEETKRKMSAAKTGQTHSEETKEKIRKSKTGQTHSEETKRKMSVSRRSQNYYSRPVKAENINTGEILSFSSINEAIITLGVNHNSRSNIYNCCNKDKYRKTACGFKWSWK